MANCSICGKPAGVFRSVHADCQRGVHEGQARGSGAVIIWDEGRADIRREEPGHLSFVLHGRKLDAAKRYKVAGWASVNEQNGIPVWDVIAKHLRSGKPQNRQPPGVTIKGVEDNPGMAGLG